MPRYFAVAVVLIATVFAVADDGAPLADRVDAAVKKVHDRELHVDKVTPWVIMHAAIAYERELKVTLASGDRSDGIEFLLTMAKDGDGRLYRMEGGVPRIRTRGIAPGFNESFILQDHVDQFLFCYADADLPLSTGGIAADENGGDRPFKVADLLDASKVEFKPTQELGWTLVVWSRYLPLDARWKTADGAEMNIEELVKLAVKRDPNRETEGGTHHLYGVAYALNTWRAANPGKEPAGVWAEARAYLDTYIAKAKELQNDDGSFSSAIFRGQAISKAAKTQVWATGHTIEWLVLALDAERLRQPWMTRAVERLAAMVSATPIEELSEGGLYHAAHGLRIWREKAWAVEKAG